MALQYGCRLMVTVLENEAQSNPERTFASVAKSSNISDGFYEVTFRQMKAAVDSVVDILRSHYHTLSHNETLSYLGVPDLRYNILCYAAWKCRLKAGRNRLPHKPLS